MCLNSTIAIFTHHHTIAYLNGSLVNAEPAATASSVVVMVKLPEEDDSIWWPARLVPRDEREWCIKKHGSKKQQAAERHRRPQNVHVQIKL